MSAPHFEMSATWDEQRVAPQLEQEYELDAPMYGVVHTGMGQQGLGRRQQGTQQTMQNSFDGFNSSFSQNTQHQFNFNVQSQQQQGRSLSASPRQHGYFPPVPGPSTSSQGQTQQYAQSGIFAGSSPSLPQGQMNTYQDSNMYPAYAQQGVLRSGQSHAGPATYNSSPPGYAPTFSPDLGMVDHTVPQHPYLAVDTQQDMYSGPMYKRPRLTDDYDLDPEDSDDREVGVAHEVKAKGACERCKGLKVKCEFKPGMDVCKRCSNGPHECKIPGRKKRRAPPKREHLLSQIREQTEKINKLMADLEEANRRVEAARAVAAADAPSPSQSATTENFSLITSVTSPDESDIGAHDLPESSKTKADVLDWITKARESIEAFGGYISMGGTSATREMLAGEEDGSDREAPEASGAEDDYAFDVVDDDEAEAGASGDEGSTFTSRRAGSEVPTRKERLATIPNSAAPLGLLADLSLTRNVRKMRSKSSVGGEDDASDDVGLANADYFRPSDQSPALTKPISPEHQTPHILRLGLVSPAEVEKLFDIYWNHMNLSVSLLDPVLYSAQKTYWRSPFLFTVICGIASRFYHERPELYQQAMHYARLAAGTALIGGPKSVESVHAYILLSLYPVPARKWEDDRSWIYLGVAIRIATDLNLHYPNTAKPKDEMHAREMLNRTRAWLNCFNLDRSTGSQYGKPPIISNMDYVANHSGEWWNSSPYNMKGFDIQIAAYNAELSLLGQFRAKIHSDPNSPNGFNKKLDLPSLALETDDQLAQLWEHWYKLLRENTTPADIQSNFRNGLLRLAYSYARMTVLSFGFQSGFGKTSVGDDVKLLSRCIKAAFDVTQAVLEDIAVPNQKIFLKHGPEAQSVFVTFACAFLLKLMQPRYATYVSRETRLEIRNKVGKIADLLGSPEVAVDDRHGPKLYSSFLKTLLAAPVARVDRLTPSQKRQPGKAKSVSPMVEKQPLHDDNLHAKFQSTPVTPAVPRQSMTPPPASTQFTDGVYVADSPEVVTGLGMETSPGQFMSAPLPFDMELLQSMTDPNIWPDMAIPGFGWMGTFNQGTAEMN